MKSLFLVIIAALYFTAANGLTIQNLRCEYRTNPAGIDIVNPRLSWIIESTQRGERQTAYQILVAQTAEQLARNKGDLWNSGQITSGQTTQLEYGGKPLKSGGECFWKLRVWDSKGNVSGWSKPSY